MEVGKESWKKGHGDSSEGNRHSDRGCCGWMVYAWNPITDSFVLFCKIKM